MTTEEIIAKVQELEEWEAIAAEANAQVDSLKDELKRELDSRGVEELEAGTHIIRWTSILSNRFDSTAFKKEHGEMYKLYTKQISSRRFTVSK